MYSRKTIKVWLESKKGKKDTVHSCMYIFICAKECPGKVVRGEREQSD